MGIMTPNYAPARPGRLATGAFHTSSPIKGNVFRQSASQRIDKATVGGIRMPDNRTTTVYGHPLANNFNTATQVDVQAQTSHNGHLSHPSDVLLIQPNERSILGASGRKKVVPTDKRQFGAGTDAKADTPFHRNPATTVAPSEPPSATAGERTAAKSFESTVNNWHDPNNSFITGTTSPGTGRTGTGRWQITKKGAAS